MIPNCTTAQGLRENVQGALAAGTEGLRARMVRDLELFLSHALSRQGEGRWIRMADRSSVGSGRFLVSGGVGRV
jgi:hypothetical protein